LSILRRTSDTGVISAVSHRITLSSAQVSTASLLIAAILTGYIVFSLPLMWAAIVLLVVILVVATIVDPLVGLGVVLVLGPTKPLTDFFVPQLPLDIGQIALLVTLGAWLMHKVREKKINIPHSPLALPILVFIGAASLSLVNALSVGFALKELIKWVQVVIILWLVTDCIDKRKLPTIIGLVLFAAAVQALVGVWQFGIRDRGPEHFLILNDRFYRAYGSFEQPNPYGGFLGLVLPVSLGLTMGALGVWFGYVWHSAKTRDIRQIAASVANRGFLPLIGFGALSALLLSGLLMSWSRGAWLGFGAAGAVLLFAWPRKWWLGALLLGGAAAAFVVALELNLLPGAIASRLTGFAAFVSTFDVRGVDINDLNYSVFERLAHWQAAQEMARFNPVFGVGFGNYEPVYPGYALINWPQPLGHAHNIYLNTLAETGIVGLTAYITMWLIIFWQTWRMTRQDDVWVRSIAIGLLGAWAHLSMHNFLDKLYVANLHLHIAALLGILSVLLVTQDTLLDKKVHRNESTN